MKYSSEIFLNEIDFGNHRDTAIGGMIGAGLGVGGTVVSDLIKKMKLKKELEFCDDDPICVNNVKKKLARLGNPLLNAAGNGLWYGALGAGAGALNQIAKGGVYDAYVYKNVIPPKLSSTRQAEIYGQNAKEHLADPYLMNKSKMKENPNPIFKHLYNSGSNMNWSDIINFNDIKDAYNRSNSNK